MKYIFIIALLFIGCKSEPADTKKETTTEPTPLILESDNMYTEYYEDGKQIKMTGAKTKDGKRDAIWKYFGEDGTLLSLTEYKDGVKNGFCIVYYSNGQINYRGEYKNDKKVGVWTTFDLETGGILTEKDFGEGL